MMQASEHCIALIHEFEGLSTKAYKCPAGVWTIGFGHTKGIKEGDTITRGVAERLLKNDLEELSINLTRALNADEIVVSQEQFDALCSFAFNLGLNALIHSTLWSYLSKGKDQAAADEFLKWNKARDASGKKIVLKGLTRRREAERALFLSGSAWG